MFNLLRFKMIRFLLLLLCGYVFAQTKETKQFIVAFDPAISLESDNYKDFLSKIEGIATIQESFPFEIKPLYCFTEADFDRMAAQSLKVSGTTTAIDNLRNTFEIVFPTNTTYSKELLMGMLEKNPAVRYVELHIPTKPPVDIPPVTPNYLVNQTYATANIGVNMEYAWDLGLNGQNIRVRDIEYGFNKNHEEFAHRENVMVAPNLSINSNVNPNWQEHGTAVMGIVCADPADYGIKGLAHGASEVLLYPEYTNEYFYNRFQAVSRAINNSTLGDVVIYEMQTIGASTTQDDDYVPAEYSFSIWNLTKAATDMGIIVVAAAGNGNQNLDDPMYEQYMSRGNSGAIIVGAGTASVLHNRINTSWWGSTYGSRVDLQGWGEGVLTAGYGDYATIGGDFNQRYTIFNGTSSATPIVASCVIVLQSYYYSLFNEYLLPTQMKEILQTTGYPQGTGVAGNIGPLPNMQAAIAYINSLKSNDFQLEHLNIYPNPFTDFIQIKTLDPTFLNAIVEVYNALGQLVITTTLDEQLNINTADLANGMYLIKINNPEKSIVYKMIKQ